MVSTPISSAFRHLRASPSLIFARCRFASRVDLHADICRGRAPCRRARGRSTASSSSTPKRLQLENLRARDERAVDVEKRIVSRRADQAQISALHIGQQHVLLRLVEVMNLIHEQDRLLPGSAEAVASPRRRPCASRRRCFPRRSTVSNFACVIVGDDLRQRRLAGAGRAGEDDRRQPVRLDRAAQEFARREDVFLPDKLLERARPHPRGERRSALGGLLDRLLFLSRTNRARRKIRRVGLSRISFCS